MPTPAVLATRPICSAMAISAVARAAAPWCPLVISVTPYVTKSLYVGGVTDVNNPAMPPAHPGSPATLY